MKGISKFIAATVFACAAAACAHAQSVNEIISSGKVRIGVNAGAPPFSMIDGSGATVGYDVDAANLIAKHLGVKAEIVPFTTAARIPALEANKVDIVVATLSPTPARAQTVMFTMPYSTFQLVILGAKDATFAKLEDLADKKIGVSRGTPQEAALDKMAPEGAVVTRFEDDSTTMQALISQQVDAIAIPETVYGELKKARPDIAFDPKFTLFNQYMSIAVRKDAFELRQWLNTTLSFIKQSGELDDISVKWTGKKLPPTMPVF
ncbi:transporter substrate-binding domain-containing protein [Ensifer sp. ENS11]|nr:transporter substrate-binding domain-containing protein [Ensifer sp. ENS11]AHK46459.1 putative substrate-binding component of ABC transporter [Ensifer adhaerens OV14]KQY76815.1 LacI family transcriptional regulator [Ensifer sp. Root142]MBD9489918.1 transporter substrate-binding domain-containing protein [Ensifer sp. ENS11]